jgi:threonine/homoserine/homoserine lactone efflux protein
MIALRLLVILTAAAIAVCAAGYLISGDRRYLGWAVRVIKYAGAAALIFFAVLLLERVV